MAKRSIIIQIIFAALVVLAFYVYQNEKAGQRIEFEGLYLDHNYRDLGASLNECGEKLSTTAKFKEGLLLRSNKWFSGWSCSNVGNPETIVSLNYQPDRKWRYFCEDDQGQRIEGHHVNWNIEINNIEFITTWENEEQRKAICGSLDKIIGSANEGKRTLFHCEAGRDRTGAVSGLLGYLAAELNEAKDLESIKKIVECDYQKSSSLKEHKYGRLDKFITDVVSKHGKMHRFISSECQIPAEELLTFSSRFFLP